MPKYSNIPTENWLRTRQPKTKKEILQWYSKESRILEERLKRPVIRSIETTEWIFFSNGKKREGKTETTQISKHKLSEQDYKVYKRLLDERFARLKKEFNERLRHRKDSGGN